MMLTRLLFLYCTLLLPISAFSQVQFGLGAMPYYYAQPRLVLPERTYHSQGEYQSESGTSIAGFVQMHLGSFSIRVEGSRLNYKFTSDQVNIPPFWVPEKYAEVSFEYSAFEMPVIGVYQFGNGRFQPYLGVGINVGFNEPIEFSETIYNFEDFRGDVFYDEISYEWEKNTSGIIVLGGVSIRLARSVALKIGARYVGNAAVARVFQTTNFVTNDSFGLGITSFTTTRFQYELGAEYKF